MDTHILVWWRYDPDRLSRVHTRILTLLERRNERAAVSAVSLREIAALFATGRLLTSISPDGWLEEIESGTLYRILPLTAEIAAESVRLGDGFPRDPFDQIIVATARCHGLKLMTADERIRRWGKVALV